MSKRRRRPLIRLAPVLVCLSLSTSRPPPPPLPLYDIKDLITSANPHPPPPPRALGIVAMKNQWKGGGGWEGDSESDGKKNDNPRFSRGCPVKVSALLPPLSLLVLEDLKVLKFLKDISIYEKMKNRVFCRRL